MKIDHFLRASNKPAISVLHLSATNCYCISIWDRNEVSISFYIYEEDLPKNPMLAGLLAFAKEHKS